MASQYFLLMLVGLGAGAMIYEEEFDGTSLNTKDWLIEVRSQSYNDELQRYTNRRGNLYVQGGHLVIKPLRKRYRGKLYTSGRIYSVFAWKYGRVKVRAKLTKGYGLWPAIWMLPRDYVYGDWPKSGEIDICEARGEFPGQIQSTIHYGNLSSESSGDLKIDGTIDAYHVYRLDWTPTALVYSLDGVPYLTQNLNRVMAPMYSKPGMPFDQYFRLVLNVAVGGNYVNDPSPNVKWNYPDAEMWVDYVRVYPLEDISTYKCAPTIASSYGDVCSGVIWACYNQANAVVSNKCTQQLINCCNNKNCKLLTVKTLATDVYASYDNQVNNSGSCNFGGTGKKQYVLNDGADVPIPQCRIKESASPDKICSAIRWVCSSANVYADVTPECNNASNVQSCCAAGASTCNEGRLREGAEAVFQAYYAKIPIPSSCDFGGVSYLTGA